MWRRARRQADRWKRASLRRNALAAQTQQGQLFLSCADSLFNARSSHRRWLHHLRRVQHCARKCTRLRIAGCPQRPRQDQIANRLRAIDVEAHLLLLRERRAAGRASGAHRGRRRCRAVGSLRPLNCDEQRIARLCDCDLTRAANRLDVTVLYSGGRVLVTRQPEGG